MDKEKKFKIRYLFPIIHFLLTFLNERIVLLWNDGEAVHFSVPLNNTFSYEFEKWMCYGISKIYALVIILIIWKLIFSIADKVIDKETVTVFGIILVVMLALAIIQWPDNFVRGGDNYIPYSYSLRLVPEYWHSIYLSCLFTASYMVFPHTISITLLQVFFFVCPIGYLYYRIKNSSEFGKLKWIRFLLLPMFLFRDTYVVSTNPERAEYNACFLFFFISIVAMDIIEKKKRSTAELVKLLIFSGFLAVFRTEGIIVGLGSFVLLLIFVYKPKFVKGMLAGLGLVLSFAVFSLPPKVGEIKYYGNDYSIMNSFVNLSNMLNSEEANHDYEGYEEDLKAISKITPFEYIMEYKSVGYRNWNYLNGRRDFNQSAATKEDSEAYQKAYINIVKHNPKIYIKTQWTMFLSAMATKVEAYSAPYPGEHNELEFFGRDIWEVGKNDVIQIPGRYTWINFGIRNKAMNLIVPVRDNYIKFLSESGIYSISVFLVILISVVILVKTIVDVCRKKWNTLGIGLLVLLFDGYIAVTALMMPMAANMYFHAYMYCMFAIELLYVKYLKKAA